MPLRVQCQDCGKEYTLPDASAGKRAKCKQCGAVFEIPADAPRVAAAPAAAAAPPSPKPRTTSAPPPKPPVARAPVVNDGLDVGFKDDHAGDDRAPAEPSPSKSRDGVGAPPAYTRRIAGDLDPLDLASAAEPAKPKEEVVSNRPADVREAFNAPSGAKRRKLPLKPGAKSYADNPQAKAKAAASKTVAAGHYSRFSDTPVAKVIMLVGYGAFIGLALYVAIRFSFLVLIPLAYIVGWYLFLYVPMQVLGVKMAGAIMRFKPTEPTFHLLLASNATPLALIAIGSQMGQTGLIVLMSLAVPIWFFVFMLAFRQGVVRDIVSFILSLAMPLIITLVIQFVMAEVFNRPGINLYTFLKAITHMESTESTTGDAEDDNDSPATQPANPGQ